MITQKYLKLILDYNPETGIWAWLIDEKQAGSIGSKGYRIIYIDRIRYYEHRLAWFYMTGKWPEYQIDHKNRIKNDNRWDNLREATNSQNHFNTNIRNDNISGYKGVYWNKTHKKWVVEVWVNKKRMFLGYYSDKEAAINTRKVAELKYHGEFTPAYGVIT